MLASVIAHMTEVREVWLVVTVLTSEGTPRSWGLESGASHAWKTPSHVKAGELVRC
jgi:hypothetical protein